MSRLPQEGHSGHARQGQTEPPCALQGPAEGVGGREDLRLPEITLNSQSGWCFCSSGRGWADGGNTGQDPWVQAGGMWHISRGGVRAARGWPCPPGGTLLLFSLLPWLVSGALPCSLLNMKIQPPLAPPRSMQGIATTLCRPASGPHSCAPSMGAVAAHRAPPRPVALGLSCSRREMKEGPKGRGRKMSSLFLAVSGKLLSVHFLKFIMGCSGSSFLPRLSSS